MAQSNNTEMKKDLLPNFTVKVDNGSGCLFQPVNMAYSYVLTAKHVVKGNQPIIQRQTLDRDGELIVENLEIIGVPYFHSDINKDVAIIKVKPVQGIADLIRDDNYQDDSDDYYLCGHPKAREDGDFSFRENNLQIEHRQEYGYLEAELSRAAIYGEVTGQSGGGIIKIEDSCFLLAGIQKRMAEPDERETLGRIVFAPIHFFDEIISENEEELTPLFPPYIASFARITNDIFKLDSLLIKRQLIQNELKFIAGQLCDDFTPQRILEIYGDSFLAYNTNPSLVNHKKLWISFLELLTVNQLHVENKLSYEQLNSLHKKRKLLFVDTDVWTKKLADIYKSDLSDVEKGGTVVVCATREEIPSKFEITAEELPLCDISTPIREMNISSTVTDPFKDLKLINLYKFQSHIINNVIAYSDATVNNIKEILKNETDAIL